MQVATDVRCKKICNKINLQGLDLMHNLPTSIDLLDMFLLKLYSKHSWNILIFKIHSTNNFPCMCCFYTNGYHIVEVPWWKVQWNCLKSKHRWQLFLRAHIQGNNGKNLATITNIDEGNESEGLWQWTIGFHLTYQHPI